MPSLYLFEKPNARKSVEPFLIALNVEGHVLGLKMPEDYNVALKPWILENLPIVPTKFEYKPIEAKQRLLNKINEVCKTIKPGQLESIVIATDYEAEGENIFYTVYNATALKSLNLPLKRLKLTDFTDAGIQTSLKNLQDANTSYHFYKQSKARSEMDWLIGINLTRLYTKTYGTLLQIGRIKAPVIKIIGDRQIRFKEHKQQISYKLQITFPVNGVPVKATSEKDFQQKQDADNLIKQIATVTVRKAEHKENKKNPEDLFNLGKLQQTAFKKFGFKPDETLAIAQSLYDTHKLITYPRTEGTALSPHMVQEVNLLLKSYQTYPYTSSFNISPVTENNKMLFNAEKATDHHAIIPTSTLPTEKLSIEETNIFHLILERFYQACSNQPQEYTSSVYETECHTTKLIFKTTSKKITNIGYTAYKIFSASKTEEGDSEAEDTSYPILQEKNSHNVISTETREIKTSPPPLYDYASLIKVMENPNNLDLDLNNVLSALDEKPTGFSLATQATRAGIIKEMTDPVKGMISEEKKKLILNEKGLYIYNIIKDKNFANPISSASIQELAKTNDNYKTIVTDFLNKEIQTLRQLPNQNAFSQQKESLGNCPQCKTPVFETKNGFMCESNFNFLRNQPKEKDNSEPLIFPCGFSAPKTFSGATITGQDIKTLLSGKQTKEKTFFSKKSEKDFRASLSIESGKITFKFDNNLQKNHPKSQLNTL